MRRAVGLLIVVVFMLASMAPYPADAVHPQARATLSFGFLLLAAYLVGDVLSRLRLPRITGYIVAGILFGPQVFGFVSAETVADLKLIDDLALSFIALAAGGELRIKELRSRARSIALTVLFLTTVVFLGVSVFITLARPLLPFLDGMPTTHVLAAAAIVGIFAVARSPSSAIAIISESKARGPFTEMVLGVTVVMDVLVILLFALVVAISQTATSPGTRLDVALILMMAVEIGGSIVAGTLLGLLVSLYIRYVRADLLVFLLGVAFLTTFFSRQFAIFLDQFYGIELHLEPMLICITAGFLIQNYSAGGNLFLDRIDRSSLPIYVVFFSLTGAALNIEALHSTWIIAVLLVMLRVCLIWVAAYFGARLSGDPHRFAICSGLGFITQAGVSLGLAGIVMRRFPDWGTPLATMIVAVIAINQIIGPIAFKFALSAVGEAGASRR